MLLDHVERRQIRGRVSARLAPARRITVLVWWLKSDYDGIETHHGKGPRQRGRRPRSRRHPAGSPLSLQHLPPETDEPLRFEAEFPLRRLERRRGAESLHAMTLPTGPI